MKKLLVMFLTIVLVIGTMTGCNTSNNGKSDSDSTTKATTAEKTDNKTGDATEETDGNTSDTSGNHKSLVVYYSATGTTKGVAESIAKVTGGTLFEITPKQPYTDADLDWSDDGSRVSKEHDDESLRDVELTSTTVDDWDSYDVVYIGYPIWWGIAAWPVDGFVKANDFTGKTVVPFCTAASSDIGNSGNLLKDMAGTGNWKDGKRFYGNASESDVRSWLDGLTWLKKD